MVHIDLVKVPLHHFLSDLNLQRFESVFHQFSELSNINQLVLVLASIVLVFGFLDFLMALLSSLSEEVAELF